MVDEIKSEFSHFVFLRAKDAILSKHPDWLDGKMDKETLDRIAYLNATVDCNNCLNSLMVEFMKHSEDIRLKESLLVLAETVKRHNTEQNKVIPVVNIDKPVKSGKRTLLHMACEEGSYDEVVRLVEICGASIHVKDANGWTPKDRASMIGNTDNHIKIIQYLDGKNSSKMA